MREYLKRLPQEIKMLLDKAGRIAGQRHTPAYLVGGCVRDLLLGVKNLDLDITVEGSGIAFAEELAADLGARLIRHKRFGTATIEINHQLKLDVVSARREAYPAPALLPVVCAGSLKDDLFRRDFTINAMAVSIMPAAFGELVDFFHGKKDLKEKRICILHALSFIDDPTRILRAVRFEQRYGFRIAGSTLKCLKQAVKIKMLRKVQPQRLRDELILMLKEPQVIKAIRRLNSIGDFSFISPGMRVSDKVYAFLKAIDNEVKFFHSHYPQRRSLDIWLIYFIGLIDCLSAQQAKAVCRSFALRKGEEIRILSFKRINAAWLKKISSPKLKPSGVFSLLNPLSYEAIILLKARYKSSLLRRHIDNFFKNYTAKRIDLRGDDLKHLGLKPGPQYQKIFSRVLFAKLDGIVKNRKEELSFARKLLS